MKDAIDVIKTRRCVRDYKDDMIPDEDIEFLIDCAKYAPSGFNLQPWKFMVITNKEIMWDISERSKKALIPMLEPIRKSSKKVEGFFTFLSTEGTHMFYNAPVLIVIFGNENALTTDYDCAMAAQNMMLAAHSRDIGSCWIGGVSPSFTDENFLKELGAPEGYRIIAPLVFGYPASETEMPERFEPEVTWMK
jgi:nitroreductase